MWETILDLDISKGIEVYDETCMVPVPVLVVIKVVGTGLAELAVEMDMEGLTHSEQSLHPNQVNPNGKVSERGPTRLYRPSSVCETRRK